MKSWPATIVRAFYLRDRVGTVELFPDRIEFGKRSIERSTAVTELVSWRDPIYWTTLGTALRLQTPSGSVWIGGQDCLRSTRGSGQPTTKVQASLSAAHFVDFVRALELVPDPLPALAPDDPIAIDLQPGFATYERISHLLWPWGATVALILFVALAEAAFMAPQSLAVIMPASVGIVAFIGLLFTIRNSQLPRRVRYCLLVGPRCITLCDFRASVHLVDSAAQPTAERVTYRTEGRATFECPALRLCWPSVTLVVGVWHPSFAWPIGTQRSRRLSHVVGAEEWRRLVGALGLG